MALSLASVHGVRCGACGYHGPPRPEVLARLRIAESELFRLDQRSRQLDAAGRDAIRRALRTGWGAIAVLVLGAIPFVGIAVAGVLEGLAHDGPVTNRAIVVGVICLPMVVHVSVGALLVRSISGAKRRLLAASAAVPPVRAGEPVTCAVCGAPLAVHGVDPIARCGHCAADNVVHPSALAQAVSTRAMDVDAIGVATATRAREALAAARQASALGVAAVFGTPAASFVAAVLLLAFAMILEPFAALAPSPLPRYAWVDTKRGRCIGLIAHRDGLTEAYFGGNDNLPNPMRLDALPPRFGPSAVIGRSMRLANGKQGRVASITGAPVTNREQIVLQDGRHGDLPGACADEP